MMNYELIRHSDGVGSIIAWTGGIGGYDKAYAGITRRIHESAFPESLLKFDRA